MIDFEAMFKVATKCGIGYNDFWFNLSFHEIKIICEQYHENKKEQLLLNAYSVAMGLNNVLNGVPISLGENLEQLEQSSQVSKEDKENELNELKANFYK